MKTTLWILFFAAYGVLFFAAGYRFKDHEPPKQVIVRDTIIVTKAITKDIQREIVVVPAMVAEYGSGFVSRGSVVFEYGDQQRGYILFIKKDGKVIDRIVCKQSDLQKNIDWIKYEIPIDTIKTTSK
jgi:hypothetical protein